MDYDFRSKSPPYNSSSSPATQQMYPKINPHGHATARPSHHHHHHHTPSPSSSSPGLGIRVFIKPEFRITPPPHLLPHSGDISRSNFQFDFGLERKILAEANKENPNWSKFGMENLPTKVTESASPKVSVSDPIVSKYIAMGLNREAVPLAVANYGDNPAKGSLKVFGESGLVEGKPFLGTVDFLELFPDEIPEFVKSYTLLREMGFSSTSVAETLVMYDNDTDKALAHFLNGSS